MTLELKMLALSIVLGLVQIVLASHAASLQRGDAWTESSRDEAVPKLTGHLSLDQPEEKLDKGDRGPGNGSEDRNRLDEPISFDG
jgi:hypothetical protein